MTDPYALAAAALRRLPPETAHRLAVGALAAGLAPRRAGRDDAVLATRLWGRDFPNPVGLAAGFDKNAEAPDALLGLGFGFVEVGSVTPLAQPGNPRPRVFRLVRDRALINRLGFNNQGLAAVGRRLAARAGRGGIVGANLGANKESADRAGDYVAGLEALGGLVDYVVVNVSSPNTPGLRALQEREELRRLLTRLEAARAGTAPGSVPPAPLLLKIAPDLSSGELEDVVRLALDHGVDGLIVGNTTVARPAGLRGRHRRESGGLSGRPLFAPSTELLRQAFRLTGGRIPCVGAGGIASGADAYAKIRAGAALVQLYTALAYHGPGVVGRIKADLAAALRRDGFAGVADAVGADAAGR